jgi:putative Ca2+/H+ antiporter (TMEM165/GDT1 family)/protein-S-isoprenylcysteine O-methyltransferase Ste14
MTSCDPARRDVDDDCSGRRPSWHPTVVPPMNAFLVALGLSFATIFVAELGDKSQLMALTFATRYPAVPVIIGVTVSTAAVHAVSVGVGHGLGSALSGDWINGLAAVAFLGFGLWTLRGDALTDNERNKAVKSHRSAFAATLLAFFLAELGDKTMLATITLAARYGWLGVWLGSTLGMVVADALAIFAGRRLVRRLPERTVRYGAALLFFGFALWAGVDTVERIAARRTGLRWSEFLDHRTIGWVALGLAVAGIVAVRVHRRRLGAGNRKEPAGPAALWARLLFLFAMISGLAAPLAVVFDVVPPIGLLSDPGLAAVGAGMLLLGMSVLLFTQSRTGRACTPDRTLVTTGLFGWIRHPGATGMIVATAGMFLMAPTALAVLATVMLVVSAQLQARFVAEPAMARRHGEDYADYVRRVGRFIPRVGLGDE